MSVLKRTHYCVETAKIPAGGEVVVAGWVQKQRDLGNLIFIDLRDRTGIVQLAFDDATDRDIFEQAAAARAEFVLIAKGNVRLREAPNREIPTGAIEIFVTEIQTVSKAQTPPFEISGQITAGEEIRLKYRYLDLRRLEMQRALMIRHKITKVARDYFDEQGFLEVETPILIKSTPEGARDYLVPSRVHPGKFYALPQSPQLYKQLLMLAGCDKYMQIARCFRDEDLRADRQPEFTQIDLEMSFIDEDDIMTVNEGYIQRVFAEVLGIKIEAPFRRMPYSEAMQRYGSDKPDLRYDMELVDLRDVLEGTGFKVFADTLAQGGAIKGINAKKAAELLTRREIDKLTEIVKTYKAKGLAYTRLSADAESSSYEKFLTEEEKQSVRNKLGAETGDVLLIVADADPEVACQSMGSLRVELAKRLGLADNSRFEFLWVTDFPLFEYDEEEGRYVAKHHPFTSPKQSDIDLLETDPKHCLARAYDLVLNGCEIGGGSIRINDVNLQRRMFKALGIDEATAEERFGFLLEAYKYGAPVHGGMAYGLDRLVMLMLGKDSIRDVMAFPKVQNASELMSNCPSEVPDKNLEGLGIMLRPKE